HAAGDELLRQVAGRFSACTRSTDTISRRGGDEFMLVLTDLRDPEDAVRVTRKLLRALRAPFTVAGTELHVTGSFGLALYPQDGRDASTLQRHADVAMYRAKALGRNELQCFTPTLGETALARLRLEGELRHALERGELEAYYQPQLDAKSGRVVGLEALVRWHHPRLGLLPPGEFVPVAEESGQIGALGEFMLREACRQNAAWQARGLAPVKMAVNVSSLQLLRGDLVGTVQAALRDSGLDPRWLELELAESALMDNVDGAAAQFARLRALGVGLAMDDFGTGYSSMGYLQRLPFTTLKIDRSFISAAEGNPASGPLVRAMVSLAEALGLNVIAEGVEDATQLEALRALGCPQVQGFLFARPMPATDTGTYLAGRESALKG
ncbi:MAG TPA: bifunctional diguanylate cyclase/phosphodiesterase, partial [Deinococcales bacterium]|nr:bifunctional diguanylate cyclase/phosphodiesterase [Deinococcales bacterium]